MAHINDASNTSENVRIDKWRYVKEAKVVQALVNCSLCACAGVITHGTGTLETSGAVARRAPMNFDLLHKGLILEGVDPHFQHSRTFSGKGWTGASPDSSGKVTSNIGNAESTNKTNLEQAKGIRSIAQTALGLCKVAALGDPSKPDQQHSMTECMSFMNKVGPRGCIFAVLSASDGHWNFAHMVNGQPPVRRLPDGSPRPWRCAGHGCALPEGTRPGRRARRFHRIGACFPGTGPLPQRPSHSLSPN